MFLGMDEFVETVLARRPSVSLVSWHDPHSLARFVEQLRSELTEALPDPPIVSISGAEHDSRSFAEELVQVLDGPDCESTCLLVRDIEPLAVLAGEVLNGFRERIAVLQALVLLIREDKSHDFANACPDLMDWVGPMVVRARDFGRPFTVEDVKAKIAAFEERNAKTSQAFMEDWTQGKAEAIENAWFWAELLALKADMEGGSGSGS